jgi:hypothetical protein
VPKGVSETLECLENLSHSRGVFSMARIMMSTPQRSTVEQIFNLYICSVTSEGVKDKTLATLQNMLQINPELEFTLHNKGWEPGLPLSGYIFLCLDNIDIRREITKACRNNKYVKAILDFRMGLADAQHYMADMSNEKAVNRLLETMDFTHEEAKEALPISACGTSLSVLPTIWTVISAGIANFINFYKNKTYKHTILVNPFEGFYDTF